MKLIIAIDPGASGGIAKLRLHDKKLMVFPMPEDADLRDMVQEWIEAFGAENIVCYLEQVGGFINVGGKGVGTGPAMFNFGDGFGYIRGLIDAARIKRVLVRPQVWQKGIPGIAPKMKSPVRKRALKEYAARIFPNEKVTLKTADALGILEYARRMESGSATPAIVDIPEPGQFKADAKGATKWCKANNWPSPKKNSKEFLEMVNFWVKSGRPK